MKEIIHEIFRSGNYPQGNFGEKEINEIIETYNPAVHEAPIIIGHSNDYKDSRIPAYGWVKSLKKTTDGVTKSISVFTEQLVDLFKNGNYKKFSVGLYAPNDVTNPYKGKWALHHLAVLGGQPPAVKGLEPVKFAEFQEGEGVEVEIEYEPEKMQILANEDTYKLVETFFAECLVKFNNIIQSNGEPNVISENLHQCLMECYDKCCKEITLHKDFTKKNNSIMESLKNKMVEMKEKLFNKTKEETIIQKPIEEKTMDEQKIKELETEKVKFQEQLKQQEEANKKQAEELENLRNEKITTEVKNFCEGLQKEGKYLPKFNEMGIQELLVSLAKNQNSVLNFGEQKKSGYELLKEFLQSLQKFNFGEVVIEDGKQTFPGEKKDKKQEIVAFAEQYVKDNPNKYKGNFKQQLSLALQDITNNKIQIKQ